MLVRNKQDCEDLNTELIDRQNNYKVEFTIGENI